MSSPGMSAASLLNGMLGKKGTSVKHFFDGWDVEPIAF